jgi:predicted methyltransferase
MPSHLPPLLTLKVHSALQAAARDSIATIACSLDLDRSTDTVEIGASGWTWQGRSFPYLERCKDRTIYYWTGTAFEPAARFTTSLIKLVPTDWGPPTFEIDGIKMLPTAHVSPYADAQHKVALVQPRDKAILDTCGGLGYFAAWALAGGARQVTSYEKSADVMWLRALNPWSPANSGGANDRLSLTLADITDAIALIPDGSVDAVLHDPPRFGIAGELYSAAFYQQLARVLRRKGLLFHYTGSPNALSSGRDVPREVARRLHGAGFVAELNGDGVLARRS